FVEKSAAQLGIRLRWEGQGVDEVGIVDAILTHQPAKRCPALQPGMTILRIDPRYFRPTEVETLLGDPSKARAKLGWAPEITLDQMIEEMIESDLQEARHAVLIQNAKQQP
ncbi:MAG: GDP-mannose 4,6-dehydratase, partial [Rhodoferax sp.]|nr:GDP-mannose 4,6-dehydratase [Rhodoferax sp.]MCB2044329.1 GDP-mannose 4,6-dehydratase [Rhodoferax sp.]